MSARRLNDRKFLFKFIETLKQENEKMQQLKSITTPKLEYCVSMNLVMLWQKLEENNKGRVRNNLAFFALRFRPGLVNLIEQNRSNSSAISRILRLRIDQRWPEDEMRKCQVISAPSLKPFHNVATYKIKIIFFNAIEDSHNIFFS